MNTPSDSETNALTITLISDTPSPVMEVDTGAILSGGRRRVRRNRMIGALGAGSTNRDGTDVAKPGRDPRGARRLSIAHDFVVVVGLNDVDLADPAGHRGTHRVLRVCHPRRNHRASVG